MESPRPKSQVRESYLSHTPFPLHRWMNPVIRMGNKRVLGEGDMPELPTVDTAEHLRGLAQVRSGFSAMDGSAESCLPGWC